MKKKQSFVDIPGSGLEAPRFVRTAYACWGPAFGKNVEYSARYLGRSPWAWGALKVTLISFKVVPRLKFHRPRCRPLSQCPQECLYHCILFFFFHPLKCESYFAPFWFGAEVIWKILCICACCLLWERPAPRKRASAFKKVLPLRKHSLTWRLLKCFPFCLHLGRFFFFFPVVS